VFYFFLKIVPVLQLDKFLVVFQNCTCFFRLGFFGIIWPCFGLFYCLNCWPFFEVAVVVLVHLHYCHLCWTIRILKMPVFFHLVKLDNFQSNDLPICNYDIFSASVIGYIERPNDWQIRHSCNILKIK
jgi:hypothetical protein